MPNMLWCVAGFAQTSTSAARVALGAMQCSPLASRLRALLVTPLNRRCRAARPARSTFVEPQRPRVPHLNSSPIHGNRRGSSFRGIEAQSSRCVNDGQVRCPGVGFMSDAQMLEPPRRHIAESGLSTCRCSRRPRPLPLPAAGEPVEAARAARRSWPTPTPLKALASAATSTCPSPVAAASSARLHPRHAGMA